MVTNAEHDLAEWRREEQDYPRESRWLALPSLAGEGARLHYVDEGPRDGEVVLCLHGNPSWSFYYRGLIAALTPRYRVIAFDHLGCGFSSRPRNFGYRLADHLRIVDEFTRELALSSLHLLVHDWGGPIGLGWAVRHPERIRSLVISNSAVFMEDQVARRIRLLTLPLLGEFLIRRCNVFARAALTMASAKGLSIQQQKGLLLPYQTYEQRLGIARFVQDIPLSPDHPTAPLLKEIAACLPRLRCPILLAWGMRDFCFHPGFLARWTKIFPRAEVQPFAEAGHYLLEDEPQRAPAAIANFLARVAGKG